MCKCIEEVQKSVAEENNYNRVELDCVLTNLKTEAKLTGQRIDIDYNHVLKNGSVRRKFRKSFVSHLFCPFCGVKY